MHRAQYHPMTLRMLVSGHTPCCLLCQELLFKFDLSLNRKSIVVIIILKACTQIRKL